MFFGGATSSRIFEERYKCLGTSDITGDDGASNALRQQLDIGGKIILPPSALERLSQMEVQYPLVFRVGRGDLSMSISASAGNAPSMSNSGRVSGGGSGTGTATLTEMQCTHCGVMEFSAREGVVYMPSWMMRRIGVTRGSIVTVRNVDMSVGSYIKIQPQTTAFLDITDPRAVLEHSLRNFICLTAGDIVDIVYNNRTYPVAILETKPESPSKSILVAETDLQVEFAAPPGYVEPSRSSGKPSMAGMFAAPEETKPKFVPFQGKGSSISGKTTGSSTKTSSSTTQPRTEQPAPGTLFFGGGAATSPNSPQNPGMLDAISRMLGRGGQQQQPEMSEEDEDNPAPKKTQLFTGKARTFK